MKTLSQARTRAAMKLAQYILDDEGENESFREFCFEGHNPKIHSFYLACVILGEKAWVERYAEELRGDPFHRRG